MVNAPFAPERNLSRYRIDRVWLGLFHVAATTVVLALAVILLSILNGAFGYVLVVNTVDPGLIAPGGDLARLNRDELTTLLESRLSPGLIRRFESEAPLDDRPRGELEQIVRERIIQPHVLASWTLSESFLSDGEIRRHRKAHPEAQLEFRSWLNPAFLLSPQNPQPEFTGIRAALLGSLWMVLIILVAAFPVGVATAIYLEEYARPDRWYNRAIELNIRNLAGVPSVIFGLLGLAFFVRTFEGVTRGRTILSAGLTLALFVLPMIISSSREAIRAVPDRLRDAGYCVGATRWQTIRDHVLPAASERILTGAILAVSRAVGETAPLVVLGVSAFISVDPVSLFSRFTTLPVQIFQWATRSQPQYHNLASAAIIVLLVLLLALNMSARAIRNRVSRRPYEEVSGSW
jgi:phosphate transport system permease protein